MSRGVNKVILIGHIGQDPESKATQAGDSVTTFSLATSEKWKDKHTGQSQERTEWHDVVFFAPHADNIALYCRKGSHLYIEGSIRTDSYVDKHGQKQERKKIVGNYWCQLDTKDSSKNDQTGPSQQHQTTQRSDYEQASSGTRKVSQNPPLQQSNGPPLQR